MKSMLMAMGMAVVGTVSAETVALWPLNWDKTNGRLDGRCAIDSANDLSHDANVGYDWGTSAGLGWTLPPNPDAATHLFEPVKSSVVFADGAAQGKNYAYSTTAARLVRADRDFTVETWIHFPELPAVGGLYFVLDCDGTDSSAPDQRWFLTLRNKSGADTSGVSWQLYAAANGIGDTLLHRLSAGEVSALTVGWHHLALTYNHQTAVWTFYQDGVQWGSVTGKALSTTAKTNGFFGLGGRNNGRAPKGAFTYCRISDKVLQPSEFLMQKQVETVGFWKLNRDAYGNVNGAPSAYNAHLGNGFGAYTSQPKATATYANCTLFADSDCAFAGNPPNTTVQLPNGNAGSLLGRQHEVSSAISVDKLGYSLSFTNDFTVEGWIKTEIRDLYSPSNETGYHHLIGTRMDAVGWVFQLHGCLSGTGPLVLCVHAQDGQGVVHSGDAELADFSAYRGKWTHVALSYDCDGGVNGRGLWSCYVNGVLTGSHENDVTPRDCGCDANYDGPAKFGAMRYADHAFYGKLDCWRVSKAALRPTQLLCAATGCEAASDVMALWPLNAQRGVAIDGTDVVGAYSFQQTFDAKYLVTAFADAPDVPGLSAASNGSAGFRSTAGGARSYLLLNGNNAGAVSSFADPSGSTFEAYVKRTEGATGDFIFIGAGTPGTFPTTIGEMRMNFTYSNAYPNKGFCLYVNGMTWLSGTPMQGGDAQFKDAKGNVIDLTPHVWVHLALVRSVADDVTTYTLYLDGEEKGHVSGTGKGKALDVVYIGGRPSSDSSFHGQLSCLRLSRGARTPETFLCSQTVDKTTAAFWPLDANGATLDLTSHVYGAYGRETFASQGTVQGASEGANGWVPRPDDTPDYVGERTANVGAVELLAGSSLLTADVGTCADVIASFTAEGWLKWTGAQEPGRLVIAGTYDSAADAPGGWQLVLDTTGAVPALKLRVKERHPVDVVAEGVLLADASALRGAWRHLALRYDNADGNGTWSLLLDGRSTGTVVRNAWTPVETLGMRNLRLGACSGETSCAGAYDMWRIKGGVLGKDELLWKYLGGMMLQIR